MNKGPKRPLTPTYIVFYILFAPDTWRILGGFLLAIFLTPYVVKPDMALVARTMLYVMVAAIGWAFCGKPAQWIAAGLKKAFLGKASR
ncbi:hypothetical protein ACFL5W_02385 [Thermodesulfobacteriota bacterium]